MKKILFLFLTTAILLSFSFDANAQYRGKKKKKKKSSDKKSEYLEEGENTYHKLWYGIDVNWGFSPQNIGAGYSGNTIVIGLSPMLGFKLNKNFSVGPRFGVNYQGGRYNDGNFGEDIRLDAFDFSVGIFSRFKFLKIAFAHAEIENFWESFATGILDDNNRLELERDASLHYYLGAGIGTPGQKLSFNGYFLYDISKHAGFTSDLRNNNITTENFPLVVRLGFRYRF